MPSRREVARAPPRRRARDDGLAQARRARLPHVEQPATTHRRPQHAGRRQQPALLAAHGIPRHHRADGVHAREHAARRDHVLRPAVERGQAHHARLRLRAVNAPSASAPDRAASPRPLITPAPRTTHVSSRVLFPPPGPHSRFPGDLLLRFHRNTLGILTECAAEHGDISGFRIGREPFVFLNHPDLIRDVLVTHQKNFLKGRALERARLILGHGLLTNEGDFHLRQRRLAQPAFHRERIAGYAAAMVERAARLRDTWTDGEAIDVHQAMMALTLAIVGKTLFDADIETETAEIGKALTRVLASFNFAMLPFSEFLQKLPLPISIRFARARARLDATVYRMIRERRASGVDHGDLLSMLLRATDTEGDGTGMPDEQLRDEAMTLFLAGHETTAN